ncbi:hypothetical protein CALCODRAFT_521380 [Calocera cornea HHB12733]|uniref:Uncharacterized protein n=1 Tax=Calocera cornea HHB12733 TaxID=1353952 RepID=A0A165CUT1_9BASI|nr:hypothetical protein CALCODRAFT_521380 [Calocera cornea HHB12733]
MSTTENRNAARSAPHAYSIYWSSPLFGQYGATFIIVLNVTFFLPIVASFLLLVLNFVESYENRPAADWLWGFIWNAWVELITFPFLAIWYGFVMSADEGPTAAFCCTLWCGCPAILIKGCLWSLSFVARYSQLGLTASVWDIPSNIETLTPVISYSATVFELIRNLVVGLAYTSGGCDMLLGFWILFLLLIKVLSPVMVCYEEWTKPKSEQGVLPYSWNRYAPVPADTVELPHLV